MEGKKQPKETQAHAVKQNGKLPERSNNTSYATLEKTLQKKKVRKRHHASGREKRKRKWEKRKKEKKNKQNKTTKENEEALWIKNRPECIFCYPIWQDVAKMEEKKQAKRQRKRKPNKQILEWKNTRSDTLTHTPAGLTVFKTFIPPLAPRNSVHEFRGHLHLALIFEANISRTAQKWPCIGYVRPTKAGSSLV